MKQSDPYVVYGQYVLYKIITVFLLQCIFLFYIFLTTIPLLIKFLYPPFHFPILFPLLFYNFVCFLSFLLLLPFTFFLPLFIPLFVYIFFSFFMKSFQSPQLFYIPSPVQFPCVLDWTYLRVRVSTWSTSSFYLLHHGLRFSKNIYERVFYLELESVGFVPRLNH